MVKITDVAREAGVSISTVSRALRGDPYVSLEKRKKVTAAAEKLGYTLSEKTSPKQQKPKLILVINSIMMASMCDAIRDAAFSMGYLTLFDYIGKSPTGISDSQEIFKILGRNNIAGVILFNIVYEDDPVLEQINSRYPTVQVGEAFGYPDSYSVSTDDTRATYDIVCHLLETGKKRIGFMGLAPEHSHMKYPGEREYGYMLALRQYGIEFDKELVKYGDFTVQGGEEATKEFLAMENRPDAICCVMDRMAFGCIETIKKAGLRIPEDIAVTGFDNDPIATLSTPNLTTVAQSYSEIGSEAVKMLHQIISGEITKGRRLFVNHELIVRDSTVR